MIKNITETEKYYNELLLLSSKVAIGFLLLPILMAWYYWRHLNKPLRLFHWFLVAIVLDNLLAEAVNWILTKYKTFWIPYLKTWNIHNTFFLDIFYYLIIFPFIGLFFYQLLKKYTDVKWLKYLTYGLCGFAIINHFFIEGFRTYGVISPILNEAFLIILPCLYLWFLFRNLPNITIRKNAFYWICLGLLIPNLVSLIHTFNANSIYLSDKVLYYKLQMLRNVIDVLGQFAFIMAFKQAKFIKSFDS